MANGRYVHSGYCRVGDTRISVHTDGILQVWLSHWCPIEILAPVQGWQQVGVSRLHCTRLFRGRAGITLDHPLGNN